MNNQRKQQLFNRWYDMTYDEHIRYCSEVGCIGFIKEQPDYDESDDYDNLVGQMQQVIGNNCYLFPEISVHYDERANYSAILLTILHTDGSIDEETGYQNVNKVNLYVIGMYYSKPNDKITNTYIKKYVKHQMNNPTDYIFLKAAENSKQTKLRR